MFTLADRLNEAMKNAGVTQADLHRKTGYSRTAISKWCNGQSEPKDTITLASILGVSPEWLQFGKESRASVGGHLSVVESSGKIAPIENTVRLSADEEMMIRFLRMMTPEQQQETLDDAKKVYEHNQAIVEALTGKKSA